MAHMSSHFYKFFTPSWKSLFQFPIKIEMLLEEIFIKTNTAVNDWHQHEEKKIRQCFNTLLAEKLLLLSPSALNGCAQNWTCQQMVISTVWHASWCILHCWQMKYNSPGGMLWFLKQYLHNRKTTESFHWGPRSKAPKLCCLACLVDLNSSHLFSEISASYPEMCVISIRDISSKICMSRPHLSPHT